MSAKPVLIVGLFNKENKNNHNYISAAEQLAALLSANSINVIRTSFYKSKLLRLIDTVYSIIKNNAKIEIAIVPLYGTRPSFIWQEIATRALKLFRKKIILIVHGGSIPQRMEINAAPFLKSLRRANVAVCPSAYLQQYLKQHGVNTLLIENVLDLSAYTFYQRKSVDANIMWMRAFEDTYNPEMAVRVAGLLKKKYPHFTMVMAGIGFSWPNGIHQLFNANHHLYFILLWLWVWLFWPPVVTAIILFCCRNMVGTNRMLYRVVALLRIRSGRMVVAMVDIW